MKFKFILFVGLLAASFTTAAQDKYSLNYIIGFPTGEASEFISSTSWRGIGFDYVHELDRNWAIGGSISWQTFYEDIGYQTTENGTETVSAKRYNYINSLPIHVTGSYYFKSSKDLTPFISLGVGAMYNRQEQDLGLYVLSSDAWQFSVRPELGVEYELRYGFGLRGALRYNYAAKSGGLDGLSHIGLALGVYWDN
ncbi:outer membrane beta-barrel protein [Algibacter mikhailovii]|uniref:Outer membrane protein beta-barrel domain-containing protein n=1 Tax=Algibacter mikhailovii TaxID=425498 RepID=A0A918QXH9_9FLAO|nr:outer membrane beta-barrel protein [Algibacter mikhailovii]GGZ75239.1 hypothetical protein GCM10007028_10900 [Algibacter mikhailovii]